MKRTLISLAVVLLLWGLLQFVFARPVSIVDDWLGWRQADTQTIARNFMRRGVNILYPQINWGGDGPGYVEAELQVYPALVALVMRITGEAEWPGQVLSLLFIGLIGVVLFHMLSRRYGSTAGMIATCAFLASQGPVHLSTSVQPDALCLLWYTLGLAAFLRYVEDENNGLLLAATACTAVAALIKPTALCLGVSQFVLVLLLKPRLLRNVRLWLAWVAILTVVGLYLRHAYGLYVQYGNTFGVLAGDSKFPSLRSLFTPWVYFKLAYMILAWGVGVLGIAAALYLAWKRKVQPVEVALVAGYLLGLIVALRYTTSRGYGPHYHMFGSILAAWLIAHALAILLEERWSPAATRALAGAAALILLIQYGASLWNRNHPSSFHVQREVTALGRELKMIARPGDLVVVKSVANSSAEDLWGGGPNNYEDPRIFYLADVRGWVLPADNNDPEKILNYAKRGARFYVGAGRQQESTLHKWLYQHARLERDIEPGRIYALR